MSAHTPGPWRLTISNHGWIIEAGHWAKDDYRVIAQRGPLSDETENHANAHLFHAAPELLEACKKLYAEPGGRYALEFARATMAKAEGRSP